MRATLITLFIFMLTISGWSQGLTQDHPAVQSMAANAQIELAAERDNYDVVAIMPLGDVIDETVASALVQVLRSSGWNVIDTTQTLGAINQLSLGTGSLPTGQELRQFLTSLRADAVVGVDANVAAVGRLEATFTLMDFATENVVMQVNASVEYSESGSFLEENTAVSVLIVIAVIVLLAAVRRGRG